MSKSLILFDKLMSEKRKILSELTKRKDLNIITTFDEKIVRLRTKFEAMTEKERAMALFAIAYMISEKQKESDYGNQERTNPN